MLSSKMNLYPQHFLTSKYIIQSSVSTWKTAEGIAFDMSPNE